MTKQDAKSGGLNERHLLLAELLAGGVSITEAADTVGMSRGRVSDLTRKSPRFRAELETRRFEALQELRDKLRGTVLAAAEETMKLLKDEDVSPTVRLQVAVSLLGRLEKFFSSAPKEPKDAERIAEDMATIDPMDLFKKESVNQTMKSFHLERDAAELKEDQKHGAA